MKHGIFLAGFLIMLVYNAYGQDNKVCLDQTFASWLDSKYVDDRYLIECFVPENSSIPNDSLPILFVLDADMSFGMTYDIVRWLNWRKEIPLVAIVGIAYGTTQSEWWQKRIRDFTMSQDKTEIWGKWPLAGGGDNFIKFIEHELFPFIASAYNLRSSNRTVIGISLGGLLCMDILFSKPHLFNNYIVAGPALLWNDGEIFKSEENYAKLNKSLNAVVFSSIGSLDQKRKIIEPWEELNKLIARRGYLGLIYETDIVDNETHISMFPAALTKGLKFTLNQSND